MVEGLRHRAPDVHPPGSQRRLHRPVIVSGSAGQTIRVWDPDSGELTRRPRTGQRDTALRVLTGHEDAVYAVAVGERRGQPIIISGSGDGTVRVWDLDSGAPVFEPLTGPDPRWTGPRTPWRTTIRPARASPSTAGARFGRRRAARSAATMADGYAISPLAQRLMNDTKSSSIAQGPSHGRPRHRLRLHEPGGVMPTVSPGWSPACDSGELVPDPARVRSAGASGRLPGGESAVDEDGPPVDVRAVGEQEPGPRRPLQGRSSALPACLEGLR